MVAALRFNDIRKTFATNVALERLGLELAPGEWVSLLGPSGCGKTTALRIAAGFELPDSGTVTLGGVDISRVPAHRRNMGMVFQSYSLFPNLSVAGNVAFGLRVRGVAAAERRARVGEMLERVQLAAMAERYPHQLSGGQQQRVALARALAVRPEVLLLDEPLSALDAKVRVTLRDEIRRVQTDLGITTLFVTHDQEEALAVSDRIGVMSNGRLEQLGTPTDVYRSPATPFVARFVGSMNELRGRQADPGVVTVGGLDVIVPAARSAAGTELDVLIRPEDLSLMAASRDAGTGTGAGAGGGGNGAAPSGFPGTVVSQIFAGPTTLVRVRLDALDTLVTATTRHTDGAWTAGDRVTVVPDGSQAMCEALPGAGAEELAEAGRAL